MQSPRFKRLGIDTFLGIAAGVLVTLVAGFALVTLASQARINDLVDETRGSVLPRLLDDQRLAVDLERLLVEGERVRSAKTITQRRKASLAARVLAHDLKTFANDDLRRVVVSAAGQIHVISRLIDQTLELKRDATAILAQIITLQGSTTDKVLPGANDASILSAPNAASVRHLANALANTPNHSVDALKNLYRAAALLEAAETREAMANDIWTDQSTTLELLLDRLITRSEIGAIDQLDKVQNETNSARLVLTGGFIVTILLALSFIFISQRLISRPLRAAVQALAEDPAQGTRIKIPRPSDGRLREIITIEHAAHRMAQLNQALKESERQVRLALEGGNHGLWDLVLPTGTVTISPRLAAMLGQNEDKWPPSFDDLIALVHPDDLEKMQADFQRHLDGNSDIFESIHRIWRTDGNWLWIRNRGQVVERTEEGAPVRVVGTYTDVTDQIRMERELRRSNEELEQFAYIASHDLKEPLRMISSYLGLLRHRYHGVIDSDTNEFIDFASDGAQRMATMIDDLLDFSRVHTDGAPLAPVPSGRALTSALANLDSLIKEHEAEIIVDPMPTVMADEAQLIRLFQNLIGNGIKYRLPDHPPVVRISAVCAAGRCEIRISDNGIGIDPAHHQRIFQIFARLRPRERTDGSGIGLAVCKRIVDRHGGEIRVESLANQGAIFAFTINEAP